MAESKQTRDAGSTRGNGVGRAGTHAGFADSRDVEIARLRKERDGSRARERVSRAEAEETHNRLTLLARASKRFAASMRSGTAERQRYRRRISAQYAMSGILAQAHNLEEAAPEIMRILGDRLGWDTGVLWTMNGNELRCENFWCAENPHRGPSRRLADRRASHVGWGCRVAPGLWASPSTQRSYRKRTTP